MLILTHGFGLQPITKVSEFLTTVMESHIAGTIYSQTRIVGIIGETMSTSSTLISFYRGDSHAVTVTVQNSDGSVLDISGASCKLSVKAAAANATYALQKDGTITNGAQGQLSVAFLPEDTEDLKPGKYIYDIQITLSTNEVYTVIKGQLDLLEDITRPVVAEP